ncbi:Uncharacterised protein [[Clostridium] sordellii]|uniref:hypothetical protein n=1 Tax=Paraclostridium sordellii TaxID=1505 RepID=UPI0005E1BC1A|nr:hypothetical protein [Paeniclostridium sordellii]CEN75053.1 Uncharacterised protein [[Clostridium] sordellii] [Paeniclostridium sordellii]
MSNYSKQNISTNKYIWKVLKTFNSSNNPKFILRLSNVSKIFRTILLGLIGLVEMPVPYGKNYMQ